VIWHPNLDFLSFCLVSPISSHTKMHEGLSVSSYFLHYALCLCSSYFLHCALCVHKTKLSNSPPLLLSSCISFSWPFVGSVSQRSFSTFFSDSPYYFSVSILQDNLSIHLIDEKVKADVNKGKEGDRALHDRRPAILFALLFMGVGCWAIATTVLYAKERSKRFTISFSIFAVIVYMVIQSILMRWS
jgi:hypothetical protein